jgi:hypothetical protein
MSDKVHSWSAELLCELGDGIGRITLLFSEAGGNYINGVLSLCAFGESPVTVTYPLHLSGFHIARFRTELSNCYTELVGSAQLMDWYGTVVLRMTVYGNRGRIVLGGSLVDYATYSDITSEGRFLKSSVSKSGIEVRYDGFQVDQSAIPKFLDDVSRLLEQSGVDVTSQY